MIDLEAARALLDFSARIDTHRAEEQLHGAVAIHNILRTQRVAYLADEVGMGKTYVALGALALFRHFDPGFRALIIAPRKNIQEKWQKELRNFAANNVKFDDLRVRGLDGRPARPIVHCENLLELVAETSLDPNRDFFLRLTSFSLALGKDSQSWRRTRDQLRRHLPWLPDEPFKLHNKDEFKLSFARALCCALPRFDLVIVDEAHNLKHGASRSSSARNQVLAAALGGHPLADAAERRHFPDYGPRATRVLLLSATPLEETYEHVWNQLDIFGMGAGFEELRDDTVPEARKKELAARFLIRRVTTIKIDTQEHTKNMYRREWRAGGVDTFDEPIRIESEEQRLIVALVQKKVSELLSRNRFGRSFQIGMLASFESFLQTSKLKRESADGESTFDDAEQTDNAEEREGIDVEDVNRLARNYRQHFGREMPHPKMDAVCKSLADTWASGRKTLVFVRRVASVDELKRKLDERYDEWLIGTLRERLPETLRDEFERLVKRYREEKGDTAARRQASVSEPRSPGDDDADLQDHGGLDTFFAWFFRGEGPKGFVSGANIQERFTKPSSAYSTFFADNHVMALLGAEPGEVLPILAQALTISLDETHARVRERSARYLSRRAKTFTPAGRFDAAQAAALELLQECPVESLRREAEVLWEELYRHAKAPSSAREAPPEIAGALETPTFFTEVRRPRWAALRGSIWPVPDISDLDADGLRRRVREQVLRAGLLATAARLGHALIDLYVAALAGRTTLATRAAGGDAYDRDEDTSARRLLDEYLAILESQREGPGPRTWGALDELAAISANFDLILDVNAPEARTEPLTGARRLFAGLLRQQEPVGGMWGQINGTLVRQFRMPGYPFVLITTDILQEGEDLHTFCSSVMHYGISWTPSAMEQRIGRIDRVRSQSDRRLTALQRGPTGDELLQVYVPFLEDTVEVLQVERVLDRLDTFLRLMHEGLTNHAINDPHKVDVEREIVAMRRRSVVERELLKSAFPVPATALRGSRTVLAVTPELASEVRGRFDRLRARSLGGLPMEWAESSPRGALLGTALLADGRVQPFMLVLRSDHGLPVVRCISPIGRTSSGEDADDLVGPAARLHSRVGAIPTGEKYDLTVEDDVLLGDIDVDLDRVGLLVHRVVTQADRLERDHFDDEQDARLDAFEEDLRKETGDGGPLA
ncbi:MAG TPA: DEAD/DEAH box helicase family protein [Nannocystaceae bacterium]|nr:DEAD/DEAH box helicase family protein [Nannocystaceae bacterium]